jgi:hypothetical protein
LPANTASVKATPVERVGMESQHSKSVFLLKGVQWTMRKQRRGEEG